MHSNTNIFIGVFKENYIYHLIQEKRNIYQKYIANLFVIWTGTLHELKKFKLEINQAHQSIKYEFNYWKNDVNFLDTTVKKNFEW